MFQNIYYDRFNEEIHLWDDELGYNRFPYKKYAYLVDPDGKYKTMDGKNVRKVTSWSKDAETLGMVYEGDVKPEMRTLIDLYGESDEISTNHCVFFFDIEVAKEGKWSTPDEAKNTITSISYYDSISKRYTCLILDRLDRIKDGVIAGSEVKRFSTEREMLLYFIEVWNSLPISIVTGWNVLWYDLVYLYNRIERIIGKGQGKWLSPIKRVDYYTTRRGDKVFKIGGISILDYMQLYKEFTYTEQSSYALDAISKYELGRGKVDYEKDLDHLFETDPVKFIEYNVEDVRLIVDLDDKLDFIAIAMGTCHKGHVPYEDVFFTSRYMEGACLTETKKRGIIATRSNRDSGGKAKGAFVKSSRPGRYEWVYDLDLTSLYPSNIMSLNISPETKVAKIIDWSSEDYLQDVDRDFTMEHFLPDGESQMANIPLKKIRKFLEDTGYSIAANGVIYQTKTQGLIPSLLDMWFGERKAYRKLASEAHERGDMETYGYYNRKQKIQKVLLNSLYGVLLLPVFRFYDKDNGEAVTLTGQQLIHFTTKMANHFYNKELGTDGIDYCLYTDTDSVFYESMPIINHRYGKVDEADIPELSIQVATEVQNFINKAYDVYAEKFHNITEHRWDIKQELIARRAFWGAAKKRYAMWIVREGNEVKDEADIKGFDSVRSSFPKLFRSFMEELIIDILHDGDPASLNSKIIQFKRQLFDYDVMDIMNPTSVKDIDKWRPMKKGIDGGDVVDKGVRFMKSTPIHVKSAMNYNRLMEALGINSAPNVENGDKILWTYLKDNPYDFNTISLMGYDDPEKIVTFVNKYINRDKLFDKALGGKLQSIWDDLGWGRIVMNPNVSKFFIFD
jgi:DNA polymerase elongation subunit (family B)